VSENLVLPSGNPFVTRLDALTPPVYPCGLPLRRAVPKEDNVQE
jgi:hypothetical protein